jgi:ABC-type multidrug transport system ATPase subunit
MILSELVLNGILHLFALQASCHGPDGRGKARKLVATYLTDYLGIVNSDQYLDLFDGFLAFYDTSTESDFLISQTSTICNNLKGHIPRTEQYAVLLRFFELVSTFDADPNDMLTCLARAAGGTFEIDSSVIADMLAFLYHPENAEKLGHNLLLVQPEAPPPGYGCKWKAFPHFSGRLTILHIEDIHTCFIISHQHAAIALNGIPVPPGSFRLLPAGAILRDDSSSALHYADIAQIFSSGRRDSDLAFTAWHVDFRFPGSDNGLHDFCFSASGGELIGVMGGSGVGKSTLISILNGTMPPQSGQIRINGLDLYTEKSTLEGVIGFVPQDDLLFDELTVYQNLFYSSRLCLANLTENDLDRRIQGILDELNQLETKDLKVGSPLEKTISGGQRKRLNIALELIREPSILFVDEPTSGLSSADSLNVMSLLKEQSNQGKLIIVIIHQPSSDIFKLFDQLWILDKGGRPIYTGNPIDALIYFRSAVWQAGTEECLCPRCGNVNPEQIFDIIEMKALDEKGYATTQRKISPSEWHARYKTSRTAADPAVDKALPAPEKVLHRPGLAGQLGIFFKRNLLTRLANKQYLGVNLLEAPLLAWIIASIARFETADGYLFGDNHNISVYFFMSVIVALFMGLSVSAEEIIRDRKILQRESFLHLSWFSYINAKTLYLALVSGLQTALYVLVGNTILEIPGFYWQTWLVLFSCSLCASMIGLNISAGFKTVVTIYIIIPLLLVPQIILGGRVVTFDDMISQHTPHNRVPLVGNLMPSRWGFEAVVVEQFMNNPYQRPYYDLKRRLSNMDYMTNYYIPELLSRIDFPFLERSDPAHKQAVGQTLELLKNEFNHLSRIEGVSPALPDNAFHPEGFSREIAGQLKSALAELRERCHRERREADESLRALDTGRRKALTDEGFLDLEKKYLNKSLERLVYNSENLDEYRIAGNSIVRVSDPLFSSQLAPWGGAPFMAGQKRIGSFLVSTFEFNLSVLWLTTCCLYAILYFHLLPRLITRIASVGKAFSRLSLTSRP